MSQITANGSGVVPPPAGFVETLTGNTGGAVPPTVGNINVVGDGTTISVNGNPGTSTLTITASSIIATQYDTDSGSAVPAAGILDILGTHGINTSGAGNTVTIAIDNDITLGDLVSIVGSTAIGLSTGDITIAAGNVNLPTTAASGLEGIITVNANNFIHSFGATNTFIGQDAGNLTLTGFSSVGVGANTLQALTSGAFNTTGGFTSQGAVTTGSNNASWGSGTLSTLTTGSENAAFGNSALNTIATGSGNTALGYNSGSSLTLADSNNILIGNTGTVGDSGRIRIGTAATHTSVFFAGIEGVDVGNVAEVVTIDNNELGSAVITAGSGITITPTANVITISATGADLLAYTNVNTTPYVVLTTDEYLGVDSSGGAITVQLPNAPSTGRVYHIKDRTGSADTNNITVTTVGGAVNIDGATTFVMNTEYEAISVLFDGSTYQIF